jgi:23S rRNA pseudouridine2605 synthase
VNGRPAALGQRVSGDERILVDSRPVRLTEPEGASRVLLYHKPPGEIVSRDDPKGRPTVFEALPRLRGERWVNIGRLDFNTSGLLLFTTSGDLANRLMHPASDISRVYAVRLRGELSPEQAEKLQSGVQLEDGPARFDSIDDAGGRGSNRWYRVSLREGRYREVRRMFEAVDQTVSRLMRIAFGPLTLPRQLRQGAYRELTPAEVKALLQAIGSAESHEPRMPPALRVESRRGAGGMIREQKNTVHVGRGGRKK